MPQYGMGFNNPYGFMPQNNNTQTMNFYDYVNGLDGMKNYPVQPNSTILLIDRSNPFAYLKTANAMGQSTIQYFKLESIDESEVKKSLYNSNSEFITRKDLEMILNPYLERLSAINKEGDK